jgi:hypothetical protein
MNIQHILAESELEERLDIFSFPLEAGRTEFSRMLKSPWTISSQVLESRQAKIQSLRKNTNVLNSVETQLKSLESAEALLLAHKPTESSKVAEGQIFFQGEATRHLNFVPYCILVCVFLKVWVAPVLALMMPLVLAVMPYVIMTQVMDMPITWDMYTVLMKQMVLGIQQGEPWRAKHWGQAIWTLVSVGQGIVQPFMTAYHTSKLDAEIIKRGEALHLIHNTIETIIKQVRTYSDSFSDIYVPDVPTEAHEAAAWYDSEPLGVQALWRALGKITVFTRIGLDLDWKLVTWKSATESSLELANFSDLAIPVKRAVNSSAEFRGHGLLTGPNRGGKSSNLRAILQQVLLGQVTGFTFRASGSWKPFGLVFTRLKSRDTAGKESLFEMEVRFASQILKTLKTERRHALVLIDELFHSTNPPDAETSAKLFLDLLWQYKYVKSIISTHIFSLCEMSHPVPIQKYCCNAEEQGDGAIRYSYTLTEGGVCRISSVREVLHESGLVRLNNI